MMLRVNRAVSVFEHNFSIKNIPWYFQHTFEEVKLFIYIYFLSKLLTNLAIIQLSQFLDVSANSEGLNAYFFWKTQLPQCNALFDNRIGIHVINIVKDRKEWTHLCINCVKHIALCFLAIEHACLQKSRFFYLPL